MASVFRKTLKNGKPSRYYMRWKDENGKYITEATYFAKKEAEAEAKRLELVAERIRRGEISRDEFGWKEAENKPILDHVKDYIADMKGRGISKEYCKRSNSSLKRMFDLGKIATITEITYEKVRGAVAVLKNQEKTNGEKMSARTANTDLTILKSFSNWLESVGRIKRTLIRHVKPYPVKVDPPCPRRSLTAEEIGHLLRVTAEGPKLVAKSHYRYGPPSHWITGPQRRLLYLVACQSGYRAKELRKLTPESFKLGANPPTINLAGKHTKNGKEACQPISVELAAELVEYLKGKPEGQPVFVFPAQQADMLKKDLKRAGIPYRTHDGQVDFHALRVSYATLLVQTGANIKTVQTLMRHASAVLTMDIYAKANDADKVQAVESLPKFGPKTPVDEASK